MPRGARDVGDPVAGKALFKSVGCKNCHTLAAAGATGTAGPNLDQLEPAYATVVDQVTHGGEYMPAFGGTLTTTQIQDIAAFVYTATRAAPSTLTGPSTKAIVISTRAVRGVGTVLVDGRGRTLYMFVPDKRKKVTCVGACAAVWPPVRLASGQKIVAKGKVKPSLLGSDRNPAGGRVVTYDKWPLYGYVADTKPGQAKGQALNLNGGLWYVLAPSGKVIVKKVA